MAFLNTNYLKLRAGYLFPEIARRVTQFTQDNPEAAARLIRCGIGDVTEPLPLAAREAMKAAVDELGVRESFRGYGPEQGYFFLREAISREAYDPKGCGIHPDEIFISDGSKCDTGNILEIFGPNNRRLQSVTSIYELGRWRCGIKCARRVIIYRTVRLMCLYCDNKLLFVWNDL